MKILRIILYGIIGVSIFILLPKNTTSPTPASVLVPQITPLPDLVLSYTPKRLIQGDPVMITISGTTTLPTTSSPTLFFFIYQGKPTAFYGTDINQKIGSTTLTMTWENGQTASTSFFLGKRIKPEEPLPIPQQLGGNSPTNQTLVVSTLEKDNTELAAIISEKNNPLWSKTFSFPVTNPTVTDPYGYQRDSGLYTIAHKGVDFHAPIGTEVFAINDGIVRVAKNYSTYGNTIVIDHGMGLLSMYMHLSKIDVVLGEKVHNGQRIGLSGETGYAEGPHLHLTIRINNVSIDPIAFFNLFGESVSN